MGDSWLGANFPPELSTHFQSLALRRVSHESMYTSSRVELTSCLPPLLFCFSVSFWIYFTVMYCPLSLLPSVDSRKCGELYNLFQFVTWLRHLCPSSMEGRTFRNCTMGGSMVRSPNKRVRPSPRRLSLERKISKSTSHLFLILMKSNLERH